jgi:branched-chain amino acid aminotransferase
MEIKGLFLIDNENVLPVENFREVEQPGSVIIYEVFRMVKRIPLFIEDHLDRFHNSALLAGVELPLTKNRISELVNKLIRLNSFETGNIKLTAVYPPANTGCKPQFNAFFIEHQYPDESQFELGVDTSTLMAVRQDPNAKIFDQDLREETDRLKEEKTVYEVLLVDEQGCITEGSRSNVFFISGTDVLTPPVKDVLPGITRKHVLEACASLGLNVSETKITFADLPGMNAAFLTGTSRKVLPVKRIDKIDFAVSNTALRSIMKEFDRLVEEYLQKHS